MSKEDEISNPQILYQNTQIMIKISTNWNIIFQQNRVYHLVKCLTIVEWLRKCVVFYI